MTNFDRRQFFGAAALAAVAPFEASAQTSRLRHSRRKRLQAVKSWGYQLRLIDFDVVARSAHELVVLDATMSRQLRYVRDYTREEISTAQARPDGGKRTVLAYLSIGEAERYRPYWDRAWQEHGGTPPWLGPVNPKWVENYPVRFWDADWQRRIFGSPAASLDRIIDQGFDGVYFDRADVFSEWTSERRTAEADMVTFVTSLSAYARNQKPDFLVVMQNAEELLRRPPLISVLDGIAKEDLWYGLDFKEGPNPASEIRDSIALLRKARNTGLAVLSVEYISEPTAISHYERNAKTERFVPHVADRTLFRLNEPPITSFKPYASAPPPP